MCNAKQKYYFNEYYITWNETQFFYGKCIFLNWRS